MRVTRLSIIMAMNRFMAFLFVLALILLSFAACRPDPGSQPGAQNLEPTASEPVAAAEPDLTATKTYLPVVEVQPTLTPIPSATPSPSPSPTVPPPTHTPEPVSAVRVEPVVTGGLVRPLFVTHAGDERLFIIEQAGLIRIIEDGQLLTQPFLDLRDRVGSVANEQGLLGLAFHPSYAVEGSSGYGTFYVNYTDYGGNTRISRFSVTDNPDIADPQSEIIYLTAQQPYPNHNGGSLAFGPDGYLYAGLGDGGSAGDPNNYGQSLNTLLGKILRLDVDTEPGAYTIPPDNPFIGAGDAMPEIWAYGLRNPWRFSFDRATGDLYVADVGQNMWEEVSFQPGGSAGGENYGWRIMEASHCYRPAEGCDPSGLVMPVFEYDHSQGCSVTGGYVYRGTLYPEMDGNYFVADYCTGMIWRLAPTADGWATDLVLDSDLIISSFGEDSGGELFLTDFKSGGVFRLVPDN